MHLQSVSIYISPLRIVVIIIIIYITTTNTATTTITTIYTCFSDDNVV